MFYVSGLKEEMHNGLVGVTDTSDGVTKYYVDNALVGVTDTSDGVTEYYASNALIKLIKNDEFTSEIYGADVYNNKLEVAILSIDKTLNESELQKRITDWKCVHNPWTGLPVKYYLAESKVGTVIVAKYTDTTSSGRVFTGVTKLTRLSYDEWLYEDENSVNTGRIGDTSFAAYCLEVATIYSKLKSLRIDYTK